MRLIFTCGGTAGHVNPAIAVAGRLRELFPDCEILFIGAEGKMEMQLVPREGYEIKGLDITNISREMSLKGAVHNARTVVNTIRSLRRAKEIIKDFRPDAVIGTGGYVCYPVLKAASEMHIPTAVHESNALPGLTTKLLEKDVDRVMVGFEESRNYYSDPSKLAVTGTPVRGAFDAYTHSGAKRELGVPEDTPLVVSVWGSLGSGHMNGVICDMIPLMKDGAPFRLIHSAGSAYYGEVSEKLEKNAPDCAQYGADVREYIYDMPRVMSAADLVLCRAGASSLAELAYIGKPALIVPSPNVTNNHQEKNARVLERAGGARVLLEGEFDERSLYRSICDLLSDGDRLAEMSRAMRSLAVPDATEKICGIILDLLR